MIFERELNRPRREAYAEAATPALSNPTQFHRLKNKGNHRRKPGCACLHHSLSAHSSMRTCDEPTYNLLSDFRDLKSLSQTGICKALNQSRIDFRMIPISSKHCGRSGRRTARALHRWWRDLIQFNNNPVHTTNNRLSCHRCYITQLLLYYWC